MEYYSTIEWNKTTATHKGDAIQIPILNETSQVQNATGCMFPFI